MKKFLEQLIITLSTMAFVGLLVSILLTSCGTKSTKIGKLDADDISYFKDARTGLCFAAVGSRQGSSITSEGTGMGFTCVPCENLTNVTVNEIK